MDKRILITGGAGFIGTNLSAYYINKKETVLIIDKEKPVIPEALDYWRQVDLLDRKQLFLAINDFKPTHVIHLAAKTDLKGRDLSAYEINTTGTQNLIDALKDAGSVKKIIFTSSMLVCSPGYIPTHDLDFSPSTIYGESKKNMELLIRNQDLIAEWVIVRPTSIWGPWFKTPYRDFFDRVIAGKMYNIKVKPAACTKTYGFVLNAAFQIDKLLNAPAIGGQVFYLGDDPPLNIREWANLICDKLGKKRPPEIPYVFFFIAAKLGDLLTKAGLPFPMTSFRLKNMTTGNVLPLKNLYAVTGPVPYSEAEAVTITLNWINNNK